MSATSSTPTASDAPNKPSLAGLLMQSGAHQQQQQHHNGPSGGGRSGAHHRGGGGGRTSPSARSSPSYHGGGGSHPNFSSNPSAGAYNTHHPSSAHNLFKTAANNYTDRSPTNRGLNGTGYHGGASSPGGGGSSSTSNRNGGGRMSNLARGMSGPPSPSAALSGILSVAGEPLACTETNMDWTKLNIFRTRLCDRLTQTNSCHMANRCLFSHDLSWPRRTPFLPRATALTLRYIPVWCPRIPWPPLLGVCDSMGKISWTSTSPDWDPQTAHNLCIRGDNCPFVHNLEEFLYHPEIYKTTRCCLANDDVAGVNEDQQGTGSCVALCPWYFCPFAHDTYEQRDIKSLRCGWHPPPQIVDNHFVARTQGFDEVELAIIEFLRKSPGGSLELYRNPSSPLRRLWHKHLPPVFRPLSGSSLERLVPSIAHTHAYFDDLTYFVIIASLQNLLLYPVENFYVPSLLSLQCAVLQYQLNISSLGGTSAPSNFPPQMDCLSLLQEYDRRFAASDPASGIPKSLNRGTLQQGPNYASNGRHFLLPNPASDSQATNDWKTKQEDAKIRFPTNLPSTLPSPPSVPSNEPDAPAAFGAYSNSGAHLSPTHLHPAHHQVQHNHHLSPGFFPTSYREEDEKSGSSPFFSVPAGFDLSPSGRSADASSAAEDGEKNGNNTNIWKMMDFNAGRGEGSSLSGGGGCDGSVSGNAGERYSSSNGGYSPVNGGGYSPTNCDGPSPSSSSPSPSAAAGESHLQRERAELRNLLQSVNAGGDPAPYSPSNMSGALDNRSPGYGPAGPVPVAFGNDLLHNNAAAHCSNNCYGNDNALSSPQGFLNPTDLEGSNEGGATCPAAVAPNDVDTQQLCASLIQTLNSPNGANFLAALFNLVSTNSSPESSADILGLNLAATGSFPPSPSSTHPTLASTPDNNANKSGNFDFINTAGDANSGGGVGDDGAPSEEESRPAKGSIDEPTSNFLE